MSIKEMVQEINHAIAAGEMTIKGAERLLPMIEQLTGRPCTFCAGRVVFYDKTTATKHEKISDAWANL